jgi:hypothetical protein
MFPENRNQKISLTIFEKGKLEINSKQQFYF